MTKGDVRVGFKPPVLHPCEWQCKAQLGLRQPSQQAAEVEKTVRVEVEVLEVKEMGVGVGVGARGVPQFTRVILVITHLPKLGSPIDGERKLGEKQY